MEMAFISSQQYVRLVRDCFASVDRDYPQGRLASSAEHIKRTEDSGLDDVRGSELFKEITRLEQYYPTSTEPGIPREAAKPIGALVQPRPVVVECGVGAAVNWTDADRLLAAFGLVAAEPARGG